MSIEFPRLGFCSWAPRHPMGWNDDHSWEPISKDWVIAVHQASVKNRQLFCSESHATWIANVAGSTDQFMALFNLSDGIVTVAADIGKASIRDLWSRRESGTVDGFLQVEFPPHGADLYRLCLTS